MSPRGDNLRKPRPDPPTFEQSGPGDPPHWACPSCGEPCYCVDATVRAMPHVACMRLEVIYDERDLPRPLVAA